MVTSVNRPCYTKFHRLSGSPNLHFLKVGFYTRGSPHSGKTETLNPYLGSMKFSLYGTHGRSLLNAG